MVAQGAGRPRSAYGAPAAATPSGHGAATRRLTVRAAEPVAQPPVAPVGRHRSRPAGTPGTLQPVRVLRPLCTLTTAARCELSVVPGAASSGAAGRAHAPYDPEGARRPTATITVTIPSRRAPGPTSPRPNRWPAPASFPAPISPRPDTGRLRRLSDRGIGAAASLAPSAGQGPGTLVGVVAGVPVVRRCGTVAHELLLADGRASGGYECVGGRRRCRRDGARASAKGAASGGHRSLPCSSSAHGCLARRTLGPEVGVYRVSGSADSRLRHRGRPHGHHGQLAGVRRSSQCRVPCRRLTSGA